MYGVVRERAPIRPVQMIAGLAVSALVTAGAATVLMSGFGDLVGALAPTETTLTTIAPDKETTPPPPDEIVVPDDAVKLPPTTAVPLEDWDFTEKRETTITATGGDVVRGGDPEAVVPPPPKAVLVAPKLQSREKPLYPMTEVRQRNEGNTAIDVCLDTRGRVTSATLKTPSGHPRLDEAALKWVKGARFSPGTLGGVAQSVCGHTVVYEWRLENAR